MTQPLLWSLAGAYGTGVLASLSPCVYPMVPITLGFLGRQTAGPGKSPRKAVALFALGQTVALVIVGMVAVKLGESLGFSSQSPVVRAGTGLLLLLAAAFSWRGRLPAWMEKWNFVSNRTQRGAGLTSAFLLGASAALVASPCTSPLLGGVLAMMATEGTELAGVSLMTAYATGFTTLFLVAGLGLVRWSALPRSGNWLTWSHRLASLLLAGAGIFYVATAVT